MLAECMAGLYLDDMKPLTTSIYTFETLRNEGFLYVDKTAGIYELIRRTGQYFMSRPRRFGKSLLVSTLKAIFQGRRELFAGLALADLDYDWKPYPVIHLDMGAMASSDAAELRQNLLRGVRRSADDNHCALADGTTAYQAFEDLITGLARRDGKVVILIDEYDKPLLGHLGQESARAIQAELKRFYAVVKSTEPHQRFVLITGVSKFSRVSIFSDLNNLTDLTMSEQASTILGYTQQEVETCFPDYIQSLADKLNQSVESTGESLRLWYNGYKFHHSSPTIYNPVSLMKCLVNKEFRNYWFETGTPTFLLNLLKQKPVDLDNLQVDENAFSTYDPINLEPLPLLVQTGYLTIKQAEQIGDTRYYTLGYPNLEIAQSFSYWLVRTMAGVADPDLSSALRQMVKALQAGDVDTMLEHLKTFFHNIPHDIVEQKEKYYQTIFFNVFKLIGAMIEAEARTSLGRIDAVIKTEGHIYIFEFKLRGTAGEALRQIRDKQYAAPYRDDPRKTLLIGVEFSPAGRNLANWLVEPA